MEKDDKAKQSGSTTWSWKRRRLLRSRIRSRYEHSQCKWHLAPFIYIPAVAEHHISGPQRAHQATILGELDRLAALDVPWACAILSYFALLLKEDGSRDIERAVSLCEGPARAGDAYAQYMLSWALRLRGESRGISENMKRSANKLFPPAVLDLASIYSSSWDAKQRKNEEKLRLALSDRLGHAGTFGRRLQFYREGRFGALDLILGYLLMPCALARWIFAVTFSPHSAAVCLFDPKLSTKDVEFDRSNHEAAPSNRSE